MELVILWFMMGIISSFFCLTVAEAKGLSGFLWALGGLFFGVIALIAVAGMPDRLRRNEIREARERAREKDESYMPDRLR